jgi:hypothetical protein
VSVAALAAAAGSATGSPTVFTTRKPDRQALSTRKNPPKVGLLM